MRRFLLGRFAVIAGVAGIACGLAEARGDQGIPLPRPVPSLPRGAPTGREFVFTLPPQIAAERCQIDSLQTGAFGGFSGPVKSARAGALAVRTGFDDHPAGTLKAAVWCPGFAMVLVDVPSLEQSGWQAAIAPVPLRDIPLTGRVLPPDDGVSLSGATLRIYYSADWLCGFFGLFDCLVSSWEVATGRIADDGSFTVMVPDFTNDPSVGPVAGWTAGKGWFTLRADRQEAPWNYWLSPAGDSMGHVPVAGEYPNLVMNSRRH